MKFNEKLIKLRKENNLSQEELGEKLEVARQTISKWELGETTPEMDKLIKLSEIFNITLDNLVKDENEPEIKNDPNNTNTQKLAGIIIKLLKIAGIIIGAIFVFWFAVIIFALLRFNENPKVTTESQIISNVQVDEIFEEE